MKTLLLALLSFALSALSPAQTCREIVRDASGRIVQTIDRQKGSGETVQATTRNALGRLTDSQTTNTSHSESFTGTQRDAQYCQNKSF